MSEYPRSENGAKVNMIKQKFEQNLSPKEKPSQQSYQQELKDSLRRSLSASPVKSKKNLKLNVSRQLSNPGKNIKRTPAFRGDKLSRTRNLQSPTKERFVSIVDQNVKIFEEKPEYGKIGNVKKKLNDLNGEASELTERKIEENREGRVIDEEINRCNGWRDPTRPRVGENRVRTTVISRQKNISPIYKRDDEACNGRVTNNRWEESDRFLKNGVEYTRVRKQPSFCPTNAFERENNVTVQEELSRRLNLNELNAEIESKQPSRPRLTDTLKAALQAPLPSGPPPKKPPRTFAHPRCVEIPPDVKSDEDYLSRSSEPEILPRVEDKLTRFGKTSDKIVHLDSRKMLEKLEHVLIQHQKALGPKVITPRKEMITDFVTRETRETSRDKNFSNRLSRTLEDSKKYSSPTKDSKSRKHSTFDCLPSLNCATSSVYDKNCPDFKSYFTASSEDLLPGNAKFYDEVTTDKSPADKRLSNELTSFFDGKKPEPIKERVYAEPFAFDKNSGTDITGYGILTPEERNYFSRSLKEERFGSSSPSLATSKPELHYMCTSIEPLEDNNNVTENDSVSSKIQGTAGITKNLSLNLDHRGERAEPDKHEKIRVEQLLNQAFGKFAMAETPSDSSSDTDSLASSASIGDHLSTFNEKLRLLKNWENTIKPSKDELHRSLTEKRKNYVRRVSSKYSERRESLVDGRNKLFQVCLLVELNLSTRQPYIKDKYPVYAKTPAWIENFCFPDASDWPPSSQSSQNQFYSLALMDERGNRRYGYCCRVRPEDGPILPLAYCLITKYRASGFYYKVLLELESRHGLPDKRRRNFIEELYNSPMPKPGQSLRMTTDEINRELSSRSPTPTDNKSSNNNFISSKLTDSSEKIGQKSNVQSQLGNDRTIPPTSDTVENVITRLSDPRLEERDMSQLFDAVTNKVLVILFGSLLLERKVVLLCDKLSKLSSCVEALESLLYPFTWPHTFIPVLPDIPGLSEILQAPLPFVIGIFKNSPNTEVASVQDGIVVDLDTSKIVCAMGDESSILPSRLEKKIRSALQLVSSNTKSGDGIRNFLVSEAFLRAFVQTCSHYDSHFATQQDGKVIFQKESFVKASSSKTEQYFLEWFVETTMFNTFIQDCIERIECSGSCERDDIKLFHQRVAEYRKGSEKSAQAKKGCSKKKTLGDRLKDLTNFHA